MPVNRPYHRTCRQFIDGHYAEGGRWKYIRHPDYAESPEHYIRAFLLIQKDLQSLFDYIEPADTNLLCFSYRIHELLLRSCVEVEANCKAILKENGYTKKGDLKMEDYKKIEYSHRLSSYQVKVPFWHGHQNLRTPFAAWAHGGSLSWYQAYNATKHDRHQAFAQATFSHLIDAVCGLVAVLAAQFYTEDFSPAPSRLALEGNGDGMESAIGEYFRIQFPNDWPVEQRYDFNWQSLKNENNPFQTFDFDSLPHQGNQV